MHFASSTWPNRRWAHSPDGRWWWNGSAWVPAFSPDGTLWWDGNQWSKRGADLSKTRRVLVVIGWLLTILVLLFDVVAGFNGANRSIGHDISGTALYLGFFCVVVGPVVVSLTWWFDGRPLRPCLPRIQRLVVVGLSVGIPLAFVAYELISFKY